MLAAVQGPVYDPKSVAYDQTVHEPDRTGPPLSGGTPKWPVTSVGYAPDIASLARQSPAKTGTISDQQPDGLQRGTRTSSRCTSGRAYETLMSGTGSWARRRPAVRSRSRRSGRCQRPHPFGPPQECRSKTTAPGHFTDGALNSLEGSTARRCSPAAHLGSGSAKSILTTLQQGLARRSPDQTGVRTVRRDGTQQPAAAQVCRRAGCRATQ